MTVFYTWHIPGNTGQLLTAKLILKEDELRVIKSFPNSVWPTMLTPFTNDNKINYSALEQMVEWYIGNGVSGLFAVCQSSEMFCLSLDERVNIARFVKEKAAGRVPVIASGHISDDFKSQVEELNAMASTGIDALILITNRLASKDEDDDIFLKNLDRLVSELPPDIPLGFYECPYPYKRILSPRVMKECAETGRFFFYKDTCCDIGQIREKLKVIKGTSLRLYNANTSTLLQSLKDGVAGYCGVMANFHPELYVWLCSNPYSPKAQTVSDLLTMCSLIERQYYPANAKYAMKLCGLDVGIKCRVKNEQYFTASFAEEVKAIMRITHYIKDKIIRE